MPKPKSNSGQYIIYYPSAAKHRLSDRRTQYLGEFGDSSFADFINESYISAQNVSGHRVILDSAPDRCALLRGGTVVASRESPRTLDTGYVSSYD